MWRRRSCVRRNRCSDDPITEACFLSSTMLCFHPHILADSPKQLAMHEVP